MMRTYWMHGTSSGSRHQALIRQRRYPRTLQRCVREYLHATAADAIAHGERTAAKMYGDDPDADEGIARARAGEYLEVCIVGEDTDGTPLVEPTGRYHHVRYRAPRGI